jgi:hypothetical protein
MLVMRLNGIISPTAALRCKRPLIVGLDATAELSIERNCGRVEVLRRTKEMEITMGSLTYLTDPVIHMSSEMALKTLK